RGLARSLLQPIGKLGLIRKRFHGRPDGAGSKALAARLRCLLRLCENAEKAPIAHDCNDSGHSARAGLIHGHQLSALGTGPHDSPMKHAGEREIVNERPRSEHLARNVDALEIVPDQAAIGGALWWNGSRCTAVEIDSSGKLPIACAHIPRAADQPILDL